MSRIIYNQRYDQLELNGTPLYNGDNLELYVMGYWLPGTVHKDASGWFLVTRDQVGIRLVPGLRARLPDVSLTIMSPTQGEDFFNHEKST